MKNSLALIIIILFLKTNSLAATVFGCDIGWTWIGQDSFIITLTLIGDCRDAATPNPDFYLTCNSTSDTLLYSGFNLVSVSDVTNLCRNQCSECQGNCSFGFGIKKYVFSKLAALPSTSNCCEIKIIPSTGYRPSTIKNGTGNLYLYTYAIFNKCIDSFAESPRFLNPPFINEALYNGVIYEPETVLRNGDSLSFQLVKPLKGPGIPVSFNGSYSFGSPVYYWGFPNDSLTVPRGFHLDPHNGRLVFSAFKAEESMFAVEVNVFRQGVRVATLRREMGYASINASYNNHPELFAPLSVSSCVGYPVKINIGSNDFDMNDSVSVYCFHDLDNAAFLDSNGILKHSTGQLTWTPEKLDMNTSPKTVFFLATDNSCPVPRSTLKKCLIYIKPDTLNIVVRIQDLSCGNYSFAVDTMASKSNPVYNWELDASIRKNSDSFIYHFNVPGKHNVDFVLTTDSFCSHPFHDDIEVDTFINVSLPYDTVLCYADSTDIQASVKGSQGAFEIFWSTGDSNVLKISTGAITRQKFFTVTATDSICSSSDKISISNYPAVYIGFIPDLCLDEAPFNLNMFVNTTGGIWYASKQGSITNGNIFNPQSAGTGFHWVWYDYTDTVHGCHQLDSALIKVNPQPDVIISRLPEFCRTDSPRVLDSFASLKGGNWSSEKNGLIFQNKLYPAKVTAGIYTIYYDYYDPVSGCYDKDTTRIRIKETPLVFAETDDGDTIFCNTSGLVNLNAWPNGGYWSEINGAIVAPGFFNPSICRDSFSVYHPVYTFMDTNGCQGTARLNLWVYPLPVLEINIDSGLCDYDTLYLQAKVKNAEGIEWNLTHEAKGVINYDSGLKAFYIPAPDDLEKGYFRLLARTVMGASPCNYAIDTIKVWISNYPLADFKILSGKSGYPETDTFRFLDESTINKGSIVAVQWDFGDKKTSNLFNPAHVYDSSGIYDVSLMALSHAGCADSLKKEDLIRIIPLSVVDYKAVDWLRIENHGQGKFNLIFQRYEGSAQVEVFNLQGKKIISEKCNSPVVEIDLFKYSRGFYILKISIDDKKFSCFLVNP